MTTTNERTTMTDTLDPTDWRVIQPAFESRFPSATIAQVHAVRNRLPRGCNFMTQTHLGYTVDSDGNVVEVTTDIMPVCGARPRRSTRVFGLTWPRIDTMPDERDRLVDSLDEVAEAIGLTS